MLREKAQSFGAVRSCLEPAAEGLLAPRGERDGEGRGGVEEGGDCDQLRPTATYCDLLRPAATCCDLLRPFF